MPEAGKLGILNELRCADPIPFDMDYTRRPGLLRGGILDRRRRRGDGLVAGRAIRTRAVRAALPPIPTPPGPTPTPAACAATLQTHNHVAVNKIAVSL
jgi:hypothetical protein